MLKKTTQIWNISESDQIVFINNLQICTKSLNHQMDKQFKHIHTRQIDEISGGDTTFKKELIDIMLDQIPEFTQNIKIFYKENKWNDLAREAHTAKSSALTFGMEKAGTMLKDIQLLAEEEIQDKLIPLINDVLFEFEAAVPELEELKLAL